MSESPGVTLTPALTSLLALSCGLAVANLYYAQPLIAVIAPAVGLKDQWAGLVMTFTQLGYGLGLLMIVPLADIVENRRLICGALCVAALGLFAVASAAHFAWFLSASFVVGLSSVAAQVLVPFASHLAPAASRGRVTGRVMGGLLTGILLARPASSFMAANCGWRVVFAASGALLLILVFILWRKLPERRPPFVERYRLVLASLRDLALHSPILRRRALYQGLLFGAFNVFWTAAPLQLIRHHGMTLNGVALFSLIGAGGALAAPLAGRLADRQLIQPATRWSMFAALLALIIAAGADSLKSVTLLATAGLVLDASVQVCLVLSLHSLYMLDPAQRSRLNGLFMAWVFGCGSAASVAAASLCESEGWITVVGFGAVLVAVALMLHVREARSHYPVRV